MNNKILKIAGTLGMFAVGLGAFGAHVLKDMLIQNGTTETYKTAVLYHLFHTLSILFLVAVPIKSKPIIAGLWVSGILLFSGSLYLISILQLTYLGIITPFGGLLFLAGWFVLIFNSKA